MRSATQRLLALLGLSSLSGVGLAQSFTPFLPPSYPLAVRTPYLQAWLPGGLARDLPTAVPQFWTGENDLSWVIQARVDGKVFDLLGVPDPNGSTPATLKSGDFTATHSTFALTAGGVGIELDFFSPVAPKNLLRQSLPFSYLTVKVSGANGKNVQIFSSIDDSWVAQSGNSHATFTNQDGFSVWGLTSATAIPFTEINDMAGWGTAVFAGSKGSAAGLTHARAGGAELRSQFASKGALAGTNTGSSYAVGLAYNLGAVEDTAQVQFVIGYVRPKAIDHLGKPQAHFYRSKFPEIFGAVKHVFTDYQGALTQSNNLDNTIDSKGADVAGQNYSAILALSTRQILGGTDVTIPGDSLDASSPAIFMKEISSNGNLNTVDVIFPTFPFYYIFWPEWIKLILQPMINYLEGGTYPEKYVIHDMGSHYPNSTGHDDSTEEKMPVEESGNLLIMLLAYQLRTGDTSWRDNHRKLFDGYAEYLINNGLYPTNQLSTNDGLGSFTNMTTLAMKSAIALDAYAKVTGNQTYSKTAKRFADTIYTDGVGVRVSEATGKKYFTLTYQDPTWFMHFNLYPQKLLGLDTFPQEAFDGQSALYPTVRGVYGVPMEGKVRWGKTDWQIWSAAVAGPKVKERMVNDLYHFVSNEQNDEPFSDRYWAKNPNAGKTARNFRDRPTLGGHFALWALAL